jgi:DNA excision repair protein ERCC-4
VTILVDTREEPSGIVAELNDLGLEVRVCSLALADYVVSGVVGIERKTVRDLHRSVTVGRLWTQIASLRADLHTAYLLVEGTDLDHGCLSRDGVRGALLEAMALGVNVIRANDVHDSAIWLARIARRTAQRGGGVPERPRRSRRRPSVTPASILSGIPGISPRVAAALLERFGSIAGVAAASSAELELIGGIGRARAATIQRALAESTGPNRGSG